MRTPSSQYKLPLMDGEGRSSVRDIGFNGLGLYLLPLLFRLPYPCSSAIDRYSCNRNNVSDLCEDNDEDHDESARRKI